MTTCDVVIVGAGPYGLSIGAHLKERGVDFRIVGKPMDTWLSHMPKGMRLKSEGFASWLYDPGRTFTLESYCRENKIQYSRIGLPVPLEVFSSYGLEFQKRFLPELEDKLVDSIVASGSGFQVGLEGGAIISAKRVVLAVGLTHYPYVPPALGQLPEELVSHSSKHHDLDKFRGQEVIVIGGGASALDLAALLNEAGSKVQVVARKSVIRFHDPPKTVSPSFLDQLRQPITGIGPGWKLFWCVNAPLLFRRMPQRFRLENVREILGPAPCWFIKKEVVGKVPMHVGLSIEEAAPYNGKVRLQLVGASGNTKTLTADHVIAATGYKVDLRRLGFLDTALRAQIRSVENTPVLSSNFESSVPGLYFVGVSAANTFGPLLRFAFGAGFTAKRLSQHLASSAIRHSSKTAPIPRRAGQQDKGSPFAEVETSLKSD